MNEEHARPVDIRQLLRDHHLRDRKLARLLAPADWQGELRQQLAAHRQPQPWLASSEDMRLFANSFSLFFVALMAFLI